MYGLTDDDKKIIQGIISEIESTHWIQRFYRRTFRKSKAHPEGKVCYCLVGHVNAACGVKRINTASDRRTNNPQRERIISAMQQALNQRTFWIKRWASDWTTCPANGVEQFNDAFTTDKKKVIRLLKTVSK